MTTRHCPRCGAPLVEGQRFCAQCGYDLRSWWDCPDAGTTDDEMDDDYSERDLSMASWGRHSRRGRGCPPQQDEAPDECGEGDGSPGATEDDHADAVAPPQPQPPTDAVHAAPAEPETTDADDANAGGTDAAETDLDETRSQPPQDGRPCEPPAEEPPAVRPFLPVSRHDPRLYVEDSDISHRRLLACGLAALTVVVLALVIATCGWRMARPDPQAAAVNEASSRRDTGADEAGSEDGATRADQGASWAAFLHQTS